MSTSDDDGIAIAQHAMSFELQQTLCRGGAFSFSPASKYGDGRVIAVQWSDLTNITMGSESLWIIGAFLLSSLYFALSISLLAVTDFGEQTKGKDIAITLAVLTGLPVGIAVLGVVGLFVGMITGQIKFWA